jgi:hypothetical protein
MERPSYPKLPEWFVPFVSMYFASILLAKYLLEINIDGFLRYFGFAPILISIFMAGRCHMRDFKKYEILKLRWEISNIEDWIRSNENELIDGQPWYDDEDPNNWEFNIKYSIRRKKETLEELQQKLEEKMQDI